jgi:hypothetical protein
MSNISIPDTRPSWTFVKIGDFEYMDRLLRLGELYFRPLRDFSKMEEGQRGDSLEGYGRIITIEANPIVTIQPTLPVVPSFKVRPERIALGGSHARKGIYCMSLLCTAPAYDRENPCNAITLIKSGFILHFCTALTEFGEWAVVLWNPEEFSKRLRNCLGLLNFGYHANEVEYVESINGILKLDAFKKLSKFQHQSEWRIVTQDDANIPFTIRIGSLEDIAYLVKFEISATTTTG